MTTQVATEIARNLTRLPPLPNAEHQRLFNAENATISSDGRVFVTGSTAIYEVLRACGDEDPQYPSRYEYREISMIADSVPKDCFRNGITTFEHHLYLACAHVHQWEKSFFLDTGSPLSAISQTQLLNFMRLLLAQIFSQVDSYILRADLRRNPLQFDECVAIRDKCFANGLAADSRGDLYVANSIPGISCIYKMMWPMVGEHPPRYITWFRTLAHHVINGLKCKDDSVYYTCMQLPWMFARLEEINLQCGEAGNPKNVYSTFGIFDDFDIGNDGLIIANPSDFINLAEVVRRKTVAGSLIFVSRNGNVFGILRDEKLIHPSAVKIVDRESRVFTKGDVIITDKGADGEYTVLIFTPDKKHLHWLLTS